MSYWYRIVSLCAVACFFPVSLLAQVSPPGHMSGGGFNPHNIQVGHRALAGKVTTLRGDTIPGAKVVVEASFAGGFRTLRTDDQGKFMTEYFVSEELVMNSSATVEVVKKGFLKSRIVVDFGPTDQSRMYPITLRDAHEDPRLLSQADLVSSLSASLKEAVASYGLSSAGRKACARGVEEFLDHRRPDRALAPFNEVLRRDPSCVPCRAMLGLAQLDSGDWDGAERNFGDAITAIRADRTQGRPEPLVAYGVMETWREDPEKAAGFFQEALEIAPRDPLALQELGRSELLLHNWGSADAYLQKALDAGAGPEARLLRVRALLGENSTVPAYQEMSRYLDGRNVKTMPMHVRQTWDEIMDRKKVEAAYAKAHTIDAEASIDALRRRWPELGSLEPAKDQAPLSSILSAVGKNVEEFFRNFPNTSSVEEVRQEKRRHAGDVGDTRDQKFRYLCFAPTEVGGPGFSEYRLNVSGEPGPQGGLGDGFMLTSGFAATSLLFHPAHQPETTFRYLGRQKLNGRDMFVITFAQDPAKARSLSEFKSGEQVVTVFSQGLAWVDAETYQILRLRIDLLAPLPQMKLNGETTDIDFAEVRFNRIAQGFWLPREVTVSVDWNGRLLRNVHQYSDFKVFQVDATQKIGSPKDAGEN